MKKKMMLFLCVIPLYAFSQESAKIKKTYTEEEFLKKVNEEVKLKIDSLKTKSISELTKEIVDRETQLRLKESEIVKKEEELRASESDLAKKFIELQEKQKSFIACVEKNKEEEGSRISQVVDMISNMKPQKAAEVLSVQDEVVAVQILQAIDSKKASKIFNFMEKDISAKLQKQYLEMKR
jgi:flagellar motility protein MotE (MotC chaperone)